MQNRNIPRSMAQTLGSSRLIGAKLLARIYEKMLDLHRQRAAAPPRTDKPRWTARFPPRTR